VTTRSCLTTIRSTPKHGNSKPMMSMSPPQKRPPIPSSAFLQRHQRAELRLLRAATEIRQETFALDAAPDSALHPLVVLVHVVRSPSPFHER
jgi:hypothetical protein